MKEGGEIIDMIDVGEILDLKFVTHHFTADPNGKMLLGMAFVLSKQYSDKLSVDVLQVTRRALFTSPWCEWSIAGTVSAL